MKTLFGRTENGRSVDLYTIENDRLKVSIMNFGAIVVSIVEKRTGIDILKGYDTFAGYRNDPHHMGGFIGRTANRIRNAQFMLDTNTYHITANENGITNLHGGNGFDRQIYGVEEYPDCLRFSRISPDGEEGFPGNMTVSITYYLHGSVLRMEAEAVSDQDTLFAFTNHNYYNLDRSDSILSHTLQIHADAYAPNDEWNIARSDLKPVAGTPFDFREPKEIGRDIHREDGQLQMCRGYDHYFAIGGSGLREMAVCRGQKLQMIVRSDLSGMHVYTGNVLNGIGKNGETNSPHSAICFEPEYQPNAINEKTVEPKPILKAGQKRRNRIEIQLDTIPESA